MKVEYIKSADEITLGDVCYSEKLKDYLVLTDFNLNNVSFQLIGDHENGTGEVYTSDNIKKLKLTFEDNLDLEEVPVCKECGLYCFYCFTYYDEHYCGSKHLCKNVNKKHYNEEFENNPKEVYYTEYIFY